MEKQENLLRACSGCAGDHEDPDFSAWDVDVEEDTEISGGKMWAPGGEAEEEE